MVKREVEYKFNFNFLFSIQNINLLNKQTVDHEYCFLNACYNYWTFLNTYYVKVFYHFYLITVRALPTQTLISSQTGSFHQ